MKTNFRWHHMPHVDDYMTGADDEQQLIELYHQLNQLVAQAQMQSGKWKSNNVSLIERINAEIINSEELMELRDDSTSILGLKWQPSSDCSRFNITEEWDNSIPIAKRTVTSAIAKIYDPVGYLAPIVIPAKSFIQETWKSSTKWDDELSDNFQNRWVTFYNDLRAINNVKIPRWLETTKEREIEVFGFADASGIGYGAAIYIRCVQNDQIWCNLLISKFKDEGCSSKEEQYSSTGITSVRTTRKFDEECA